jgi:hypothetical protein
MQGKRRLQQWVLTVVVLGLAMPAWAQGRRGSEEGQPQPAARVQITQNTTIAVCGNNCDCGAATLMSKQDGICKVQSSTGSCQVGSGECCVCAVAHAVAVCGDTCDCSGSALLTRVSAPCEVTSAAGQCYVSSGQCCVCVPH